MKVGYDQKIYKYRFASQAGIKVLPLIISTAGVMHSTFYKFIHKIFPDSILRSKVLLDITVALARGRGLIYARNVQEVAVDF